MLKYDLGEFCNWVEKQPDGKLLLNVLSPRLICRLHDMMNAFTDEVECEAIREEIQFEQRRKEQLDTERATARAARERTAHRNASDAVRAEVDYDTEMKLPKGKTCSDCVHVARCVDVLGCTNPERMKCDFYPNRFTEKQTPSVPAAAPTEKPQYDCDAEHNCTFLGRHNEFDLWYTAFDAIGPTVIARYSSDGPDYYSGMCFGWIEDYQPDHPLVEARKRAEAMGLDVQRERFAGRMRRYSSWMYYQLPKE